MNARYPLRSVAIVAFLLGGIVGGAGGVYLATRFTTSFFSDGWLVGTAVGVRDHVVILERIKRGEIEAASEQLESMLDTGIISLGNAESEVQTTSSTVDSALNRARNYRATYPRHTSSPEFDKAVSDALRGKDN